MRCSIAHPLVLPSVAVQCIAHTRGGSPAWFNIDCVALQATKRLRLKKALETQARGLKKELRRHTEEVTATPNGGSVIRQRQKDDV